MIFEIEKKPSTELKNTKRISLSDISWKEKDLENLLANNITKLIPESRLMILFQERPFQEEADILALDEDGNLHIFELKRWESNSENILQVLRYGQRFGQYSYDNLEELFQKYSELENSLQEKHYEYFKDSRETKLNKSDFNKKQKFIVITDGTDLETLNAIKYWKKNGIDIESLPYRIFEVNQTYLFEFNQYNPNDDIYIELEQGYYIVNTNLTYSKSNYKEMLSRRKASGYGPRKFGLSNIKKDNTVFLYHTGFGIVACGKAINDVQKKEEEYFVCLEFEWKIDPDSDSDKNKVVSAKEINNKLNSGHRFRQTCFSINKEFADEIKNIYNEKTKVKA